MDKKTISKLIVILSLCLLTFGISGCAATQGTTSYSNLPPVPAYILQEAPNTSVLSAHFSLLGIGRITGLTNDPPRTVIRTQRETFPPENLEQDVTAFHAGENIIIYGHVIYTASVTAVCFKDGEAGYTKIDYWGPAPFSDKYMTAEPGAIIVDYNPPDFILPTYLKLDAGQYRIKIFAGETLVAIFPFEIL